MSSWRGVLISWTSYPSLKCGDVVMTAVKRWLVKSAEAVRCSVWFGDPTRKIPTPVFVVDVTKFPIFPPNQEVWSTYIPFCGDLNTETDFSRRQTAAWNEYIKAYGEAYGEARASQQSPSDSHL